VGVTIHPKMAILAFCTWQINGSGLSPPGRINDWVWAERVEQRQINNRQREDPLVGTRIGGSRNQGCYSHGMLICASIVG